MEPASIERVLRDNPAFLVRPLVDVEREAIQRAMIFCRGDRTIAAKRLGISQATLYRKLRQYEKAAVRGLYGV